MFATWIGRAFSFSASRLAPRTRRLGVEPLEVRAVPATIVVTGTGDTIANDGFVTLREALTAANTIRRDDIARSRDEVAAWYPRQLGDV